MKTFIFVAAVALLVSCNQRSSVSAEDEAVLTNSAFFPGTKAPGFQEENTDGGFIEGPGAGSSAGDSGVIGDPSSANGGTSSSVTDGATSTSAGDGGGSASTISDSGSSTNSGGSVSDSSATSGSSTTVVSQSATPNTSGSDGGFLPGGSIGSGNDGGTISAGSSGLSGSQPGVSVGATTNDGSATEGSVVGNSAGIVSGSGSDGSATSNPSVSASITQSGSGSKQPSGSDGGSIGNSSSGGSDTGSVAQDGSSSSSTSGSSSSSSGTSTGTQSGSSASVTPGSSSTGDGSSWASSVSSLIQLLTSLTGTTAPQPATDGGSIPGGGNGSGSDGGTVGSGSGTNGGGNSGNTSGGSSGGTSGGSGTSAGNTSGGNGDTSDNKIAICHMPPGNTDNGEEISIAVSAVDAHLSHGDVLGKCPLVEPNGDTIKVGINRVCSAYRSTITYPQFIFFEEAKRPRLSLEVVRSSCSCQCSCSSSSGQAIPSEPVLASIDLSRHDLLERRFSQAVSFNLEAFKSAHPLSWRRYYVQTRVCEDANNNGRCSDETGARVLSVSAPMFTLSQIPKQLSIDVWNGRNLTRTGDPEFCEKQYSPLILDLAGNGFKLTSAGEGVSFDLNASGEAITTAWVSGSDDAFLVRDVNGNGRIDNGSELFGNATLLSNGKRAANGFEALKDLDSNRDGMFSATDEAFSEVKLWLDKNRNGVSERGELLRLPRANVVSIDLGYKDINEVDAFGNQTRQRSIFRRRVRGESYALQIIDIWFNTLVGH